MAPKKQAKKKDVGNKTTTTTTTTTTSTNNIDNIRKKSQKNKKGTTSSTTTTTLISWKSGLAGSILAVLGFSILFGNNNNRNSQGDPIIVPWVQKICQQSKKFQSYCHESIIPVGRTFHAVDDIPTNQHILRIPQSFQLNDFDALRHSAVQRFFTARHHPTNNPLDTGAFFTIYFLWHQHQQQQKQKQKVETNLLVDYFLQVLPTKEDSFANHPIFWSQSQRDQWIPYVSPVHTWTTGFSSMIDSEYQALQTAVTDDAMNNNNDHSDDYNDDIFSPTFFTNITLTEYKIMRLAVLTRSMSNYHLPPGGLLDDEIQKYKKLVGVDLSDKGGGRHAMVPVGELINHHLNAHTSWMFNSGSGRRSRSMQKNENFNDFILYSTKPIPAGQEIMMPYGTYTLSWLYAKFGFVNGDSSGPILANFAVHHPVLGDDLLKRFAFFPQGQEDYNGNDNGKEDIYYENFIKTYSYMGSSSSSSSFSMKDVMNKYLQYDDGYAECLIQGQSSASLSFSERDIQLKQLKLEHLLRISQAKDWWNVVLPPRGKDPNIFPSLTHTEFPNEYDDGGNPPKYFAHPFNYALPPNLLSLCRLITLHTVDYNGQAVEVLQNALMNTDTFLQVPYQSKESEYRTLQCIRRLVNLAKVQYGKSPDEMYNEVDRLNREEPFGREWALGHVKLSELQALELMDQSAASSLKIFETLDLESSPLFIVRSEPCPDSNTDEIGSQG